MMGFESDVPLEAKALANYAYNLAATEYTEFFNGKEKIFPAWQESPMTVEQFEALDLRKV
jgi:hypothetical protein